MEHHLRAVSLEQWAAENGRITTADVDSHIHAGLRSKPTSKTYDRWNSRRLAELQDARDATKAAYEAEISAGRIRDFTRTERLIATANGDDDNESVQAARRVLQKRGISWRKEPI